jgi:hypothetical protein
MSDGAAVEIRLANIIGRLFKLGVAAPLALAACGVGYYYAVYLPGRDARIAHEWLLEQARAEAAADAAQAQLLAARQAAQQYLAEAAAAAQTRYLACVADAGAAHDAAWAGECKRLADQAQQDHAGCVANAKLSQAYCDSSYPPRDTSPHCALPAEISSPIDAGLARARDRCLQESKAAGP